MGASTLQMLLDGEATRDAVVGAFRAHLGRAMAGDVALFAYAGHGSEEPAPPEIAHLEPTGRIQTLMFHDCNRRVDGTAAARPGRQGAQPAARRGRGQRPARRRHPRLLPLRRRHPRPVRPDAGLDPGRRQRRGRLAGPRRGGRHAAALDGVRARRAGVVERATATARRPRRLPLVRDGQGAPGRRGDAWSVLRRPRRRPRRAGHAHHLPLVADDGAGAGGADRPGPAPGAVPARSRRVGRMRCSSTVPSQPVAASFTVSRGVDGWEVDAGHRPRPSRPGRRRGVRAGVHGAGRRAGGRGARHGRRRRSLERRADRVGARRRRLRRRRRRRPAAARRGPARSVGRSGAGRPATWRHRRRRRRRARRGRRGDRLGRRPTARRRRTSGRSIPSTGSAGAVRLRVAVPEPGIVEIRRADGSLVASPLSGVGVTRGCGAPRGRPSRARRPVGAGQVARRPPVAARRRRDPRRLRRRWRARPADRPIAGRWRQTAATSSRTSRGADGSWQPPRVFVELRNRDRRRPLRGRARPHRSLPLPRRAADRAPRTRPLVRPVVGRPDPGVPAGWAPGRPGGGGAGLAQGRRQRRRLRRHRPSTSPRSTSRRRAVRPSAGRRATPSSGSPHEPTAATSRRRTRRPPWLAGPPRPSPSTPAVPH